MTAQRKEIVPQGELTASLILELLNKGHTQREIARAYGKSPAGVSYIRKTAGPQYRTPREVAMESNPWSDIASDFKATAPYKRAMLHLEYVVAGAKGLSKVQLEQLRRWYDGFDTYKYVLEFRPDNPPSRGIMAGGFAYVPRVEGDGTLLIRENEFTVLTDEMREVWRMPDERPRV